MLLNGQSCHQMTSRRERLFAATVVPLYFDAIILRARAHGKLERILNWKIAQKSLGQPRVYATTCDLSEIICAYF